MAHTIHLEIVTSTATAIKANIKELYIPAYLGKAGVMEDHKPYISLLQPGEICYTDVQDKKHYLYIHDGFMEVNENKIVIISDSVEKGEALVKDEIEQKLSDLDKNIKNYSKLQAGMSEQEMKDIPAKLEVAIKEQQEYTAKLEIVQKVEAGK
jgi:F-type H+-transporting ATPase subunit epsilon